MAQERRRSPKLAQSRRRHTPHGDDESDENETGGQQLIDDSGSETNSDDELQPSGSDNEDEVEEQPQEEDVKSKVREHSKDSESPPTAESYDRLEDDTLHGVGFVDLAASNGSVGPTSKVTDTAIMLNGFKDIPKDENDVEEEDAMQFDELDDSISFEPRQSDKKPVSTSSIRGTPSSLFRGAARDRPERESYWQRRSREKEEYKKRLEDPTFTPFVGDFFMHDSREKKQFESLNQFGGPRGRGRGRGGRGFRGGPPRDVPVRDDPPQEALWGHDGFEELEPQPTPYTKVYFHPNWSNPRRRPGVSLVHLAVKHLKIMVLPASPHLNMHLEKTPSVHKTQRNLLLVQQRVTTTISHPSQVLKSPSTSPFPTVRSSSKISP
jgi:hypothetical protein